MPIYPDIRPDWLKPENASVLDPWYKKAVRGLVNIAGGDRPDVSIADPMTVVEKPVKGFVEALKNLGPALEKGKEFAKEFAQLRKTEGPLSAPARSFVQQLEEFAAQPIKGPAGPPEPYGFEIPERPRVRIPEGFYMKPQLPHHVNPALPHGGQRTLGLTKTSPTVEADRIAKSRFEHLQRGINQKMPKAEVPSVRGLEELRSIVTKGPEAKRAVPETSYERRLRERGPGALRSVASATRATKITDEQVRQARQMAKDGFSTREIGDKLSIKTQTIYDIVHGKTRTGVK